MKTVCKDILCIFYKAYKLKRANVKEINVGKIIVALSRLTVKIGNRYKFQTFFLCKITCSLSRVLIIAEKITENVI